MVGEDGDENVDEREKEDGGESSEEKVGRDEG